MTDTVNLSLPRRGFVGVFCFLASCALLTLGREPWVTWFYCFAWWSYILFADALVMRLTGRSQLSQAPRDWLVIVPFSVCLWLIFEAYNLVLENWFYVGVPRNEVERWLGYAAAFGTVLPALFETKDLLEALGLFRQRIFSVIRVPQRALVLSLVLGAACLVLPLVWPEVCFPLVWGGFIFLLEPLVYWAGGPSLLRMAEERGLREFYLLLSAGLVCGFLWEFWNYWAGAKWVYNIPYVHFFRLGEMPLLGFLGFPPFAVECYLMVVSFDLVWRRFKLPARGLLAAGALAWMAVMFRMIDHHTVWLFR